MKYIPFANTDVRVSKFCLGTMMFGERCDETEADKIIGTALANLSGQSATEATPEGDATVAAEAFTPIGIHSVTVFDASGMRLDGYNDVVEAAAAVAPEHSLVIEHRDGEGLLRVTAPVLGKGGFRGFFRIDFSKQTLESLVRQNFWTAIVVSARRPTALIKS